MIKLLVVYNKIWTYRDKIFQLLNQDFDLTVAFSDPGFRNKKYPYKTMYLPVRNVGPFEIHRSNLRQVASQFDVVICLSNIRWLSVLNLAFGRRNFKLGYWGIGVRASYKNKFDAPNPWDRIRYILAKKSDFMLFYSSYPIPRYVKAGISDEKLFVANNTVEVGYNDIGFDAAKKINLLFIGTLYKEKGLDKLLNAYASLFSKNKNIPNLIIIGDGPERSQIEDIIAFLQIGNKVKLLGSIHEPAEVSEIFTTSIACISPNQAGLSVLTAMGNRTMFVTKANATTGGEIFNIANNVNGIIYENDEVLPDILAWIIDNPLEVSKMNDAARNHYFENRTPELMANSIKFAVFHALDK